MNYCIYCGRECTGEVSNDEGFVETIFGPVSEDPSCTTCEPPHTSAVWEGKSVAGGSYQRCDV